MPYQVFGERAGALALMIAWSRSAIARSGFGISAIFASTSLSPSALPERRETDFSSWARSLIAARSSAVNPLDALLVDRFVPVFAGFFSAIAGTSMRRMSLREGQTPGRVRHRRARSVRPRYL